MLKARVGAGSAVAVGLLVAHAQRRDGQAASLLECGSRVAAQALGLLVTAAQWAAWQAPCLLERCAQGALGALAFGLPRGADGAVKRDDES